MTNSHLSPQQLREMRKPLYQKFVKRMWRWLGYSLLAVLLTFLGLSFSNLPDTEQLENPKSELASEVIAANGDGMGRYFIENRVQVTYDQLSPHLIHALIATEDIRYYKHCGIDFEALGRVFFKTILMADASSGGASTITQQLAKLLFTGPKAKSFFPRVVQKLKEWIIAVRLEKKYTKEEIIAMYLNKAEFLFDSYGIKSAAETYFGKSQKDLNIQEAAMLVGMLKNPSMFNPKRNLKKAELRRTVVLDQMRKSGIITRAEYDKLRKTPVDLTKFRRKSHTQGLAQYFRSELAKILSKEILIGDDAEKKADGSPYNIYTDGLKIYTTIDPVIQQHAEEAMVVHMKKLQNRFWKVWGSKKISPWDYKNTETTDKELNYRKWKLSQMVRESERYLIMRGRSIGALEDDLEKEVDDLQLDDTALNRMVKQEGDSGFFSELISKKDLTSQQAARLREAMKNSKWNELKKQWKAFQKEVETVFNRKVNMPVFTYDNADFEKDTLMSPLDSLKYHHTFLQIGSLAVEPKTGHVKAWMGGINHKYFAYDHTRTNRQVGSTFKPFIYATAIALQGVSPCLRVIDEARTLRPGDGAFHLIKPWTPKNATGKYTGRSYQLRSALKNSVNTVSVFLMQQLGSTEPVLELLDNMGVDTKKIPAQPSICLGAADMSVQEMTGAYTTFANNGYHSRPIFVTRIEDKNGRTIYKQDTEERQALPEEANYVMVEMLKYAGNLGIQSESGGKTGTTNNYVDGWFMAITPSLVVGTWVGGEDRWVRFLTLADGQGSRMAKPFCKEFLSRVEKDKKAEYDVRAHFALPGGDLSIGLDCAQDYDGRDSDDEYDGSTGDEPGTDSGFFEDQFGEEGAPKQDTTKKKEEEDFDGGD